MSAKKIEKINKRQMKKGKSRREISNLTSK